MSREVELKPMIQCGECSTLFLQFATQELKGHTYELCPNPQCHAPRNLCTPIVEPAVSWMFMHIISTSGIEETRRMHLRCIAESQMGPWNPLYRLL